MFSPSKGEAGMSTPPKSNSLKNTALNIESTFETDQKVDAPKLPKQEQKVPNPLTSSDLDDPDKELALLIKEEIRIFHSFLREGELEQFHKFFGAWIREDIEKRTKHPQGTKTQEPTVGTQEDVQEGKQTDDAQPPRN
ncbi:hypothetical protein FPCIR_2072 [Fusarium pseudocircinatum]|uniref:Uncharacterized protein n=1 Tax=Fusarium pseudocircinatum TaxID=56676 RepID=A0A8H5PSL9_9HYPO|nr:hypothetical protein FPCIR_2072 [Fusarium pseudocircinatum]